jgi:hypothetical protein
LGLAVARITLWVVSCWCVAGEAREKPPGGTTFLFELITPYKIFAREYAMSKNAFGKNGGIVIWTLAISAIVVAAGFLIWNKKPSRLEEAGVGVFLFFVWVQGRLEEQDERITALESSIEVIEKESRN